MEDIRIHFVGGASIVAEKAVGSEFWEVWLQYLKTSQPAGFTYETDSGSTRSIQFTNVSYLERSKNRPEVMHTSGRTS